jgi:hypothetical protein
MLHWSSDVGAVALLRGKGSVVIWEAFPGREAQARVEIRGVFTSFGSNCRALDELKMAQEPNHACELSRRAR